MAWIAKGGRSGGGWNPLLDFPSNRKRAPRTIQGVAGSFSHKSKQPLEWPKALQDTCWTWNVCLGGTCIISTAVKLKPYGDSSSRALHWNFMRLHCRRHAAVYLCHVSLVLGIGSWLCFHGVLALTYPTSASNMYDDFRQTFWSMIESPILGHRRLSSELLPGHDGYPGASTPYYVPYVIEFAGHAPLVLDENNCCFAPLSPNPYGWTLFQDSVDFTSNVDPDPDPDPSRAWHPWPQPIPTGK